jgi:hypothetical protein
MNQYEKALIELKAWVMCGLTSMKPATEFNDGMEYAYRCTIKKMEELERGLQHEGK